MSLRQRLLGGRRVARLADVSPDERQVLRSFAGLFELLARTPVYAAGLRHCVEVIDDVFAEPRGQLVREVAAAVLAEVSEKYGAMNLRDESATAAARGEELRPGMAVDSVRYLLGVIGKSDVHSIDPRVSAAVIHAVLADLPRAPGIAPAPVLATAVVAAYESGNLGLIRKVTSRAADPGSGGLASLLESLRPENQSTPSVDLPVATQFANLAQVVAEEDPVFQVVAQAARDEEQRTRALLGGNAALSLANRAADAARRGDYPVAATAYDELSHARSLSAAMRAAMLVFAMCARLMAEVIDDDEDVDAEVDRFIEGRVLHARSILDLQWALNWLIGRAVDLHRGGGSPLPAIRVFDLAAECQWGAAATHAGAVDAEPTLVSLMTRDATGLDVRELTEAHPDTAFVWVRIFDNEPGVGVLRGAVAGSADCWIVRHDLDPARSSTLARSIGHDSEDLSDDEISWLTELVFGDLPPNTRHVVVVPDPVAWNIPWALLAPDHIRNVAVAPSASAYHRLAAPPARVRKVLAVFDEHLSGARQELAALTELAGRGLVELTRAHSFRELADALRGDRFDVLTVAVHGTSGDGFQYRMLLPDNETAPATLLQLPLPPVVVLGCCWSASSTEVPDTVAATVGCIAAGASIVIGGLWAIDDKATGALLARMYEKYAGGQAVGAALRGAYLELPADVRRQASGVVAIGRS